MTLLVFNPPVPPLADSVNSPTVRLLEAQFGDGYSQRAPDGINHIQDVVTLNWNVLTDADARTINSFFQSHGGYKAFRWTAPGQITEKKWVCKKWTLKRQSKDQSIFNAIAATFVQVFDL